MGGGRISFGEKLPSARCADQGQNFLNYMHEWMVRILINDFCAHGEINSLEQLSGEKGARRMVSVEIKSRY